LVALQEVDVGSLRSGFVNQLEFIAEQGGFPFWYHQVNRRVGRIAQSSNCLLSRFQAREVDDHKLPGLIPGRGAMLFRFGSAEHPLILVALHLSLSRRSRIQQLDYVSELVLGYEHVILMGDLNCQLSRLYRDSSLADTVLRPVGPEVNTFPSWRPQRSLDHILVSPSLRVVNVQVLNQPISDHLPVATEIVLPPEVRLAA
jgi:endonuclease/exonuclease/phosphatase family metal-dependent hydrolase